MNDMNVSLFVECDISKATMAVCRRGSLTSRSFCNEGGWSSFGTINTYRAVSACMTCYCILFSICYAKAWLNW